jgi:hypothetical protein
LKITFYQDPVLEQPEFVAARWKLGFQDLSD